WPSERNGARTAGATEGRARTSLSAYLPEIFARKVIAAKLQAVDNQERRMNNLMSDLRLKSFEKVLRAYTVAGGSLGDIIDGGAGAGLKSKAMLAEMPPGTIYHAFEPFPGNHRFFQNLDEHIRLIPKALAEQRKPSAFRGSSRVQADSHWGQQNMEGYSSVGRLVDKDVPGAFEVSCVRADEEIAEISRVGTVKLDLQGGELNALQGMTRFL